jgi:hypothetical protein
MAETHLLSGLLAKRAELAGLIDHHHMHLRNLVIQLDNLDATIRLFKPDIDLEVVKPKPLPPRNAAFQGEVTRAILDKLRRVQRPLTTRELALHVMECRGLDNADAALLRTIVKRVSATLKHHKNRGVLTSERGPDNHMLWNIARN